MLLRFGAYHLFNDEDNTDAAARFCEARLALAGAAGVQPSARGASVVTSGGYVAVEVQLQEMNVMSATLDEIQKQHQAIKTRVRPFSLCHVWDRPCVCTSAPALGARALGTVSEPHVIHVHSLAPSLRPFPLA